MYFSSQQRERQKEINHFILTEWDDALSVYNEYDRLYIPVWHRLNYCHAWYCEIGDYVFLKSYDTFVAVYDKYAKIFVDVLRYEYGYTSTSAQHIVKFRNMCRHIFAFSDIKREYRYYEV